MPLESDQSEQKGPLSDQLSGKFELKCIHFIRNRCRCMENLTTIGFIAVGTNVMTGTHILSKQNFLLLRPSSMPSRICHQLHQFNMLAVSDIKDSAKQFGV